MRFLAFLLSSFVLTFALVACGGSDENGSSSVQVKAPDEVKAGSPFKVTWEGPDASGDYISIAEKGTDDDSRVNRTFTDKGSPLTVRAPDTPGNYEVRYILSESDSALARKDLNVISVSASITVSDTLMVDTPIEVEWTGPDNPGDYISVAERGTDDDSRVNRTFTDNGNPLTLRTPETPGSYEFRYIMGQSDRAVARKTVSVLPLQARLRAPDTTAAGAGIEVSWIGPNGPDDFIAVAAPDADPTDYESRARSRAGTPASVFAPSRPGAYVLRYVWVEEDSVLTERPLTVTEK